MRIYGHRGAKGEAPENTEAAFRYARRLYLDGVVLDARLSSDGVPVVIHDPTVERTTGKRGRVSAMDAASLARLDARADFPHWPDHVGIPTLDDALDACSGLRSLLVNVQPDEPKRLERLCAALTETVMDREIEDRVTVMSASIDALGHLAGFGPFVARSLVAWFEDLADLGAALQYRCRSIAVPMATGSLDLVQEAHQHDLDVIGWLANTPEQVQLFESWGVDAIVSDYPSVAKRSLARR